MHGPTKATQRPTSLPRCGHRQAASQDKGTRSYHHAATGIQLYLPRSNDDPGLFRSPQWGIAAVCGGYGRLPGRTNGMVLQGTCFQNRQQLGRGQSSPPTALQKDQIGRGRGRFLQAFFLASVTDVKIRRFCWVWGTFYTV